MTVETDKLRVLRGRLERLSLALVGLLSVAMLLASSQLSTPTTARARSTSRALAFHGLYQGGVTSTATGTLDRGTGTATMLRRSTLVLREPGGPTTFGYECYADKGKGTLAATNGTQVTFLYIFSGCGQGPYTGYFLIYDGTKKLSGAHGRGTIRITGTPPSNLTYSLAGTLTY